MATVIDLSDSHMRSYIRYVSYLWPCDMSENGRMGIHTAFCPHARAECCRHPPAVLCRSVLPLEIYDLVVVSQDKGYEFRVYFKSLSLKS